MTFYIPSTKLQPFLQYVENHGLDIKTMPDDLLRAEWLRFLANAETKHAPQPFYCVGWMMDDNMCQQQCISCQTIAGDRATKIKEVKP